MSELYAFWLTRNFPDEYQSSMNTTEEFEVSVMIEGAGSPMRFSDPASVLGMIEWLGNSLVNYSEISDFDRNQDEISTTTYLLYYNPELNYQHMIRSVDRYYFEAGTVTWASSNMTILPEVRLDNIGQLYGSGSFPVEGYERLFNSN